MDQTVGINSDKPVGRGKYSKGIETRTRILESALSMFAARGYGGSSVAELAAAAGCSKNQLFHHFGSKEDLAIEAVQTAFGMWRTEVTAPTAVFANPLIRLDRVVRNVRHLESGGWPAVRLFTLLTLTADSLPDRLEIAVRAVMREIAGFTDALSQQACAVTRGIPVSGSALSATVCCLIFSWGTLGSDDGDQPVVNLVELIGLSPRQ